MRFTSLGAAHGAELSVVLSPPQLVFCLRGISSVLEEKRGIFQEAQRVEGATLIRFEPRGAEIKPDSPKCQREVCAWTACHGSYISLVLQVNLMDC